MVSVSSGVSDSVVTTFWVMAMAGYCWNLEITTAAVTENTMARAVSLRFCIMGLFGRLLAAELALEALITAVDCLHGLDRGKEGFELIMFNLCKSGNGIFW